MTNEEARLVLDNARPETAEYDKGFYDDEDLNTAINMAMEALKEKPTATLDEIRAEIDREYEELDGYDPSALGTFAESVDSILDKYQVEERPKGEWKKTYLDHVAMGERPSILYCSVCCRCIAYPTNYCPNCGADMRGE